MTEGTWGPGILFTDSGCRSNDLDGVGQTFFDKDRELKTLWL
jgi:hypothetical protein